jgi:uncharacterized repeat protein (TIGR01451 family)
MPAPLFSPSPAPRRAALLVALLGACSLTGPVSARDDGGEAGSLVATGSGRLTTRIEVQQLVVEEGSDGVTVRQFVPAGQVAAGDELYYTVRVTNAGRVPVTDIRVAKRLPYGVDFVPGSAVGPACEVEYSSDGGVTYARAGAQGSYTHVRWTLRRPLAPGATALLRFRAIFL